MGYRRRMAVRMQRKYDRWGIEVVLRKYDSRGAEEEWQ